MTVLWVHSACQAPGVACQPSVLTVSGASAASTTCAALAHTPDAFAPSAGEAAGATDAPQRPSGAAVGALDTRSPCHPLCFASATRAVGKRSGGLTVVPPTLQRPRPCSRRYPSIASRPPTGAMAQQGTGNRLKHNAWSTSCVRPVIEGMTKAGAMGKTVRPCSRRLRRHRRGCVSEGSVKPQNV
jgi:hypothetical protein